MVKESMETELMNKEWEEFEQRIQGKYTANKSFTTKELHRLSELLTKYYPAEFNIYFMQGVIVSTYSAARASIAHFYMYFGETPLIHCTRDFENDIDREEFCILHDLMCDDCIRRLKTFYTFSPLVSLESVHTQYLVFSEFNESERRNLLSWYLGYFLIFHLLFNKQAVADYLNDTSLDEYSPVAMQGIDRCINMQMDLAKFLLTSINPDFERDELVIAADYLNSLQSSDKDHKFNIYQIPQHFFDALATIYQLALRVIPHTGAKLSQPKYHYTTGSKVIH